MKPPLTVQDWQTAMDAAMYQGAAFRLAFMAATAAGLLLLHRFMRWTQGVSFTADVWPTIKDNPIAVALWSGLWGIAIAIAMGLSAG